MKIAVIGAGISGLTAASILQRRHDVTVFEAGGYAGGHTNTVTVHEGPKAIPVDTGFIVFNEPSYPNLCKLFDRLGVASRDSDMSFSVHCESTGFEYNGTNLDTLFAQRSNLANPRFWHMLAQILRFNRDARARLTNGLDDAVSVEQFVTARGYGAEFLERYLVPLGASLWSCDVSRFKQFPVRFVMEFLANHHMLQVNGRPVWKTVVGGSRQYVERLTAEFRDRIRLETPVRAVERRGASVDVSLPGGGRESFDEVVLACHADQSLAMVDTVEDEERELLACFPYQVNEAVLHTDTSLLPRREKARASWNYRIPASHRDHVTVTYNMNMLQGLESPNTYCVSLNQTGGIDATRIMRRIRYHHPLFSTGRSEAQVRHGSLIRRRGLSYCGAYWGFGFHEDGVRSALAVCDAFGMGLDS